MTVTQYLLIIIIVFLIITNFLLLFILRLKEFIHFSFNNYEDLLQSHLKKQSILFDNFGENLVKMQTDLESTFYENE